MGLSHLRGAYILALALALGSFESLACGWNISLEVLTRVRKLPLVRAL